MEKWIKYHWALTCLAWSDAGKFLEYLGGHYGQVAYTIFFAILSFVASGLLRGGLDSMSDFGLGLEAGIIGAISSNILIFMIYFFTSKSRLFQEIGVRRFQDLDSKKPEIDISEWPQEPPSYLPLNITTKSAYPMRCIVKIKKVVNKEIPEYEFPRENRPLAWRRGSTSASEAVIEANDNSQPSLFVLEAVENKLKFITYPPNPHRLPFGKYVIYLEFTVSYWWKRYIRPCKFEIVFHSDNQIERAFYRE